jgi:hypothetical protein
VFARTATDVQEVVAADHISIGIRQDRKREAAALLEALRNVRRIDADRDRPDTLCSEFIDVLLNTSQLEVAERSPIATIEDQQHRFRRTKFFSRTGKQLRQRNCPPFAVCKREVRCFLANSGRSRRCRYVARM